MPWLQRGIKWQIQRRNFCRYKRCKYSGDARSERAIKVHGKSCEKGEDYALNANATFGPDAANSHSLYLPLSLSLSRSLAFLLALVAKLVREFAHLCQLKRALTVMLRGAHTRVHSTCHSYDKHV